MTTGTATGAETTCTIIFIDQKHKDFYLKYLEKCRCQNEYHKTLVYCLEIGIFAREGLTVVD